jgi:signal transduction histidine kinase
MFSINLIVAFVGLILTSFILPKIYLNNEYLDLESASEYVLEAAKNNTMIDLVNVYAVLINDDEVTNMCRSSGNSRGHMGQMGMMNQTKDIDFGSIDGREVFKDKNGNSYIGIKISSDYGDIVVYKNYEEIRSLIKSVNLIMIAIFSFSIILSTIIAFYLGKKFTKPIVTLQKRALDISKGIYISNLKINTKDEIEDLNNSIDKMAKELETKDTMQREFISNVSHDLKTPLSVIRANSEVIKDRLVEGEEVAEYASNIIDEVDVLANLVSEILVLSKLRDNKKIINPINTNLEEFINDSFNKLKSITNNKMNLVLENNINDRTLYTFLDSNYLFRVLSNFLTNAVKHSNSEDKIILGIIRDNNNVQVYIKDFGKGISEADINYVWDRYYKDENSGGMGLGLAICKEIILTHKFTYGVKSKLGEGSEFYFNIPDKLINKI